MFFVCVRQRSHHSVHPAATTEVSTGLKSSSATDIAMCNQVSIRQYISTFEFYEMNMSFVCETKWCMREDGS